VCEISLCLPPTGSTDPDSFDCEFYFLALRALLGITVQVWRVDASRLYYRNDLSGTHISLQRLDYLDLRYRERRTLIRLFFSLLNGISRCKNDSTFHRECKIRSMWRKCYPTIMDFSPKRAKSDKRGVDFPPY